MNLRLLFVVGILFSSFGMSTINAQTPCKFFGSKMCNRYVEAEYRSNGQTNSASMAGGESATLQMVFYKGHDYRLVFCAEEHLGELSIKIKGSDGEKLFDNSEHEMATYWDFTMKKTQRFIIEVSAPGLSEDEVMEGCVAISVGVRPSVAKGFN